MLCKTYVSIHKLCNLHKGEKSQKSSNFVRKFSGGKPADKADFLTFGNIFGTFCLTVKKVLRSPRDRVSVLRRTVPRQLFCAPPHCTATGLHFLAATSVSISPLPPRQRFLFLPCPPRAEADFSLSSRSLYGTSPARQPVFPSNPQSDNFFHPTRRAGKRNGDVRDKQTAGRQFRERQRCRER